MPKQAVLASLAATGLAVGAVAGCVSAKGLTYPQMLFEIGALGPNEARIVFLRPDQRYDDASLSRMVIRVDDRIVGKLAYGGFLIEDVPPGDVVLEASAGNRLYGSCKLPLEVAVGDTLYFDAQVRPANIAAGLGGILAGGAILGGAGAIAGDVAASAAESAGKACGGPYRLTPLAPAVALQHLDRLRESR